MRAPYAGLLVLALTGVARAQDAEAASEEPPESAAAGDAATQSARAHFRLGVDFYRERNFRAALIEFQRAYADAPHYKLLYNLGQASLELQEYAGAIDYLAAYLKEGGDELAAERRQEVEQMLRYLESRIARVSITSNRQGAEVYVDDTLIGRIPLGTPARVGAGRHRFAAIYEGLPPVERTLDVAAGDEREIHLEFEDRRQAAPAPSAHIRTEIIHAEESSDSAALWTGMTTAMLGAGAITMTVLAALAQNAYDDELLSETTRARLDELRDDAETKALITDIAWSATLVAGAITALLLVTEDDAESRERAAAGVTIGLGPGAVALDGRF